MKNELYKEFIKSKDELWHPHGPKKDADFSRALGSKKIAVHWIQLPPNERSSYPHAESLEEEFVYVVSGNPHVWINGYIYQFDSGMLIGFPAGTGISHTFINNSMTTAEMVVLGERTKKENKYAYPINPELKEQHQDMWWDDFPKQEMGPHDGSPGNFSFQKIWYELPFIKNINSLERQKSFSYPGDNETFSQGVRLTDAVGLKTIAVWHEVMNPGKRSSWPHAHLIEEEFAVLLKGKATVWLNGFEYHLKPGDCVYFKPGTNIAHTLINESDDAIEFLSIGQNQLDDRNDKIFYPLHSSRNAECKEFGWLWESRPTPPYFNKHLALPSPPEIKIEKLADASEFLNRLQPLLYEREAEYSLILGLAELRANQKDKTDDYIYIAVYQNKEIIGGALITEKNLILSSIPGPMLLPLARFINENKFHFPGVIGPSVTSETFARIWNQLTGLNFTIGMEQKIYKLEQVQFQKNTFGNIEAANLSHLDTIADWLVKFTLESLPHEPMNIENARELAKHKIEKGEVFILLDENESPVSMNFVGRPTRNGISVSAVFTSVSLRKKGFASSLVAHTSQLMLERGYKFCVLYTDLKNLTSNKIYQEIGYKEIARSSQFIFGQH